MTGIQTAAIFRLDRFRIPESARAEFLHRVRETHRLLRRQPGFVRDLLLESPLPGDYFTLVTMVEWQSAGALESARAVVTARHERDNFNPRALMARLGIEASLGSFTELDH